MRTQRPAADDPRYAQPSHPNAQPQHPAAYQDPYGQQQPYGQVPQAYDGFNYPAQSPPSALTPNGNWPMPEQPYARPQSGHGDPAGYGTYAAPAADPRHGGYAEAAPPAGGYEPVARTAPPRAPAQPGYAPQFDSYYTQQPIPQQPIPQQPIPQQPIPQQPVTQPPVAQQRGGGHDPRTLPPTRPPAFDSAPHYQQVQALREQAPELRGGQYDHYAPNDPRGYDLGAYMPPANHQGQHGQYQAEPQFAPDPRDTQWSIAQPAYDDRPHGQPQHLPVPPQQGALQEYSDPHDDEGEYEDDDVRPSGGRRTLMVVAALVGAIAVGGGLAYGYKTFMPSQRSTTEAKVVKAPQQPARTQPADPGGKKIAGVESKLLDRLDSTGGESEPGAPKRVPIIRINPDGSMASPPPSPAAATVQPTAVPGLVVVDGGSGPPVAALPAPRTQPQAAASPPQQVQASAGQPIRPRIVAQAEPAPAPPAPPAVAAAAPQQPARRVASVATPTRDDAANPATTAATPRAREPVPVNPAPAPPVAKSSGGGWVAVLATVRSQADALRAFADLQQKYSGVLGDKIPDVREVDLSSKGLGMQNRLMVGPPGSREAANNVCVQLKGAGHSACWITPY